MLRAAGDRQSGWVRARRGRVGRAGVGQCPMCRRGRIGLKVLVAQLDRALPSEGKGCAFESRRGRFPALRSVGIAGGFDPQTGVWAVSEWPKLFANSGGSSEARVASTHRNRTVLQDGAFDCRGSTAHILLVHSAHALRPLIIRCRLAGRDSLDCSLSERSLPCRRRPSS